MVSVPVNHVETAPTVMAVVTPIPKVKSLGEVTNISSTFMVYICNKRIDFSLSTINREISHLRNQYVVTRDTVKEKEYMHYHRLMCKKENF